MEIARLQAAALKLSETEKAQLVGSILDSLPSADPSDTNQDSLTEAIQRGEELKSGKVAGVSEEALLSEFRATRRK